MIKKLLIAVVLISFIIACLATQDGPLRAAKGFDSLDEHAEFSQYVFEQRKKAVLEQQLQNGELSSSNAALGVDWSQLMSVSVLQCVRNNGYSTFAIPRGYQSGGQVQPNLATFVGNAWSAGFPYVDAYFFPCITCGKSAATQFKEFWDYLTANHVKIGMVWYDAESSSTQGSVAQNRQHILDWLNTAKAYGAAVGLYSSKYMWSVMYGSSDWVGPSTSTPIWYANYNNAANCNNWSSVPFGGFQKANIHQYQGDVSICGGGFDFSVLC